MQLTKAMKGILGTLLLLALFSAVMAGFLTVRLKLWFNVGSSGEAFLWSWGGLFVLFGICFLLFSDKNDE